MHNRTAFTSDRSAVFHRHLLALAMLAALGSSVTHAANECSIEYGHHTDNPRRDHVTTRTFNLGQTITLNRTQLNYVKNVSNHKVRIEMRGAIFNDVTMSSNQVEPPVAFFLTPTILETAKCLRQASNGQFFDTADQLTSILKATGANATTAARELISHFNLGLTQVVGLLKQAGYNINQVADAARDAFNASATQVAGALKSTFNASVDSAASALKAAGYSAAQVAAALAQVYNQSVDQTAQILKTVFNATADTASAALKAAGYGIGQVAAVLNQTYSQTADQTARLLKSVFNASAQAVAESLKAAGYAVNQVASALKAVYTQTATQTAQILKAVFNASANVAAVALREAGYTLAQAQEAIAAVYGVAGQELVNILKAAGYNVPLLQLPVDIKRMPITTLGR